jgi:mono/diheme cytochrome c family protein
MRLGMISFAFVFLASAAVASAAEADRQDQKPVVSVSEKVLAPFFKQHCVRCHGQEKQNGQVRFDRPAWGITNNDSAQRWQDVLDILNAGDMPPEDQPQPATAELAKVLDSLTGTLITARKRLTDTGGEIAMRRLNRREYANTIRELFGFRISVDMIPDDNEAETFDTVGADQFFSSSHFDKYLELGREIVARGFEWSAQPRQPVTTNRRDPEEHVTPRLRTLLADLDNKMRMKKEGKTWQEMGFKDEGEMQIVFSQFKNRAGKPRQYLQYPLVESGIYLAGVNNETKRFGINRGGRSADPRGSYRLRVRGGINGDPPQIRQFVRVTDNAGTVGVARVRGTTTEPQTFEVAYQGRIGQRAVSLHVEENRANIRVLDGYLNKIDRGGEWASIWIDWLEIEGPFYDEERAFFEQLVHPEPPVAKDRPAALKDEDARNLIEQFAFEAFRRNAPSGEYVDQLVALFAKNRAAGQNFEQAMGEVFAIVLSSPGFLFLQEAGDDGGRKRKLDDRELAIRLAYFLWSSPPDEELYTCVADGSLSQWEVLRTQTDRMLGDPKAASFFEGFMSQWAELDRFNAITVDENKFFRFNEGI